MMNIKRRSLAYGNPSLILQRLEDSVIKMHSTVSSMLGKEEGQA